MLASQDQALLFIGIRDDLEQQPRPFGIDRQVAQLIDYEDLVAGQGGQFAVQALLVLGPAQLHDQGRSGEESRGDALTAGCGGQRAGQVCLAGAHVPVEDQVLGIVDEVQ